MDIQCMSGRQCHNRDCDRSPCHVDRSSERNGDRVGILVQTEFFTKFHINRNIGSRTSGEECCNKAFFQTGKYQWKWILFCENKYNDRVDNEDNNSHTSNQDED